MAQQKTENTKGKERKNSKEVQINRKQSKFFVDLSKESEFLKSVFGLLEKANVKTYGSEILFKDLAVYAIGKLTEKDIVKVQEASMSEMEKVERALNEHNEKFKTSLSLGEFLTKKLGIQ